MIEDGHLLPENIIILGPRGVRQSPGEIAYAHENGVGVFPLQEIDDRGLPAILDELSDQFKDVDTVYISLDIDVVDPTFCPAQKYQDVAGMTPREILTVMRKVTKTRPIVGFDLCCFSPRYDENGRAALLAARFALEAIYACIHRY